MNEQQKFQSASAVNWNEQEVIQDILYDWATYAAAGQVQLNFFSTPVSEGTSIWDATQPKTYEDTNMEIGSQMQRGEAFRVEYIALQFVPGVNPMTQANTAAAPLAVLFAANDEHTFWDQGWLEFQVVNKVQTRGAPLSRFPGPTRMELNAAAALQYTQAAAAAASDQVAASSYKPVGPMWPMQGPGTLLEYGMKLKFTLNWSKLVPMPSALPGKVQAMLIGKRMRVSQ